MTSRSIPWTAVLLAVALTAGGMLGGAAMLGASTLGVKQGAQDGWASRTVWACDRRKAVIVEGVRPDEKLPPARAQLVADLLTDLMKYCTEEITARIAIDETISIETNGRVYRDYAIGGPLPIVKASFGEPTPREQQIWKA